jgi:hypothetical protein
MPRARRPPTLALMTPATARSTPSRLLNLSLWASASVGLLVVVLGLWVMAEDASTRGEDWDGLGLFIGKLLVAGGLLWSFPHALLSLWLVRARRNGRALTPVGTASAVLACGLMSLLLLYVAAGDARLTTLLVPICGCVFVLVTGVLVAESGR